MILKLGSRHSYIFIRNVRKSVGLILEYNNILLTIYVFDEQIVISYEKI
jgi:hypothetical protein